MDSFDFFGGFIGQRDCKSSDIGAPITFYRTCKICNRKFEDIKVLNVRGFAQSIRYRQVGAKGRTRLVDTGINHSYKIAFVCDSCLKKIEKWKTFSWCIVTALLIFLSYYLQYVLTSYFLPTLTFKEFLCDTDIKIVIFTLLIFGFFYMMEDSFMLLNCVVKLLLRLFGVKAYVCSPYEQYKTYTLEEFQKHPWILDK